MSYLLQNVFCIECQDNLFIPDELSTSGRRTDLKCQQLHLVLALADIGFYTVQSAVVATIYSVPNLIKLIKSHKYLIINRIKLLVNVIVQF